MSMNNNRAKVIINNLLAEIIDKVWESDNSQYFSWLKTEIGITDEELAELNEDGLLPIPEPNMERE